MKPLVSHSSPSKHIQVLLQDKSSAELLHQCFSILLDYTMCQLADKRVSLRLLTRSEGYVSIEVCQQIHDVLCLQLALIPRDELDQECEDNIVLDKT